MRGPPLFQLYSFCVRSIVTYLTQNWILRELRKDLDEDKFLLAVFQIIIPYLFIFSGICHLQIAIVRNYLFNEIVFLIVSAQRITTIQLDGVQYFISRMNPYSPELNYFLAYQYCRYVAISHIIP